MCIVAQGAKVMMLGREVLEYDAARMLLFAVDLPVSGQVTRASWRDPFLGFKLDLVPARVAELAARVYPHGVPKASDNRGVYVGQATDGIIDAVTRLLEVMARAEDADLLGPLVVDEILIRLLRTSDRDSCRPDRRAEVRRAPDRQGGGLDTRAFRATRHRRGDGRGRSHERVVVPPALQGGDHDEPASIPEGAPAARSPAADAVPGDGRARRVPPRRLPERFAVQPGVRALLRKRAQPRTSPGCASRDWSPLGGERPIWRRGTRRDEHRPSATNMISHLPSRKQDCFFAAGCLHSTLMSNPTDGGRLAEGQRLARLLEGPELVRVAPPRQRGDMIGNTRGGPHCEPWPPFPPSCS